jgi:hypothetical protein
MSRVERTVVWKCLFAPGLEFFTLTESDAGWELAGTVIVVQDSGPLRVVYRVECDDRWRTRQVDVAVSGGGQHRALALRVDDAGSWRLDGAPLEAPAGQIDIDLGVTPSTNTLPIRRLNLAVGQSAPVTATWLQFPSLTIGPLNQRYTRLSERRYRYESDTGFVTELEVDDGGLVTTYNGGWERMTR